MELKPIPLTHKLIDTLLESYDDCPLTYTHYSVFNAHEKLSNIDVVAYRKSRNYLDGKVTQLSPYISTGIISLSEIHHYLLSKHPYSRTRKLISELMWRTYFRALYTHNPKFSVENFDTYKTGYQNDDYALEMPQDILTGTTVNACINTFIQSLVQSGSLHNHARMYLAAYIIHFRRIHWKVGADWMFHYLVDADIASNHLSWQWIASTLSNKPYIFNLENVQRYASNVCDTSAANNPELNASYEMLQQRLFKEPVL